MKNNKKKKIQNGECGAFNPVLIECLTEIRDELKSYTQHLVESGLD